MTVRVLVANGLQKDKPEAGGETRKHEESAHDQEAWDYDLKTKSTLSATQQQQG